MAIKSSGTFLRFSEIAAEFNDSQPHSMSEFTRGGILVPESASNALIRSVAQRAAGGANGRMKWSDYYGAANGYGITIQTTVTNLNLETLFNNAQANIWASSEVKILTINSGVIVGATSTGNAALTIPSGMGGSLVIVNNGAIQGAGGASNGAVGGDAILAQSSNVTITNNGDIYAGGGAGGLGGTGGQGGSGSYSVNQWVVYGTTTCSTGWGSQPPGPTPEASCANQYGGSGYYCGNNQYGSPGPQMSSYHLGQSACTNYYTGYQPCKAVSGSGFTCQKYQAVNTPTTGGSGGAGGNGGVGQGYNQAAGTGVDPGNNGYAGGTNAGAGGGGGTGGDGGAFGVDGNAGATGDTGIQGNVGNGQAGTSGSLGGAAGKYISGISNVTINNNGNVAGTTS